MDTAVVVVGVFCFILVVLTLGSNYAFYREVQELRGEVTQLKQQVIDSRVEVARTQHYMEYVLQETQLNTGLVGADKSWRQQHKTEWATLESQMRQRLNNR